MLRSKGITFRWQVAAPGGGWQALEVGMRLPSHPFETDDANSSVLSLAHSTCKYFASNGRDVITSLPQAIDPANRQPRPTPATRNDGLTLLHLCTGRRPICTFALTGTRPLTPQSRPSTLSTCASIRREYRNSSDPWAVIRSGGSRCSRRRGRSSRSCACR